MPNEIVHIGDFDAHRDSCPVRDALLSRALAALREVKNDVNRAAANNVVWPSTQRQIDDVLRAAEAAGIK
jgi:hypothetical protein